jgi:hypothetical protein
VRSVVPVRSDATYDAVAPAATPALEGGEGMSILAGFVAVIVVCLILAVVLVGVLKMPS